MMRGRRRTAPLALVAALLLLGAGGAQADRADPRESAERARAAVRAGDTAALTALATDPEPDPFLVLAEIWFNGSAEPEARIEVAARYAKAVATARPAVGRIVDWAERLRSHASAEAVLAQRLHSYDVARRAPGDRAAVDAEEARWRGPLPDLAGDPALLLLAAEVAARWHMAYDTRHLLPLTQALAGEAQRAGWPGLEAQAFFWQARALELERRILEMRAAARRAADLWTALGLEVRAAHAHLAVAEACHLLADLPGMERALAAAERPLAGQPIELALWQRNRALLALHQGRTADAVALFEQAIEQERRLALAPNLSAALEERASMWADLGRHDRALADAREASALLAGSGDAYAAAAADATLGTLLVRAGRHEEGRDVLAGVTARFRELGQPRAAAEVAGTLARAQTALREGDAATATVARAVADLEELGDRASLGSLRLAWSDLQWSLGRKEEAVETLVQSRADFTAAGVAHGAAMALGNRGILLGRMQRFGEARACFEEAIELCVRLDMPELVARNVERLAVADIELGKPMRALKHVRRSLELRFRLGTGLGDDEALGGAEALHRVLEVGMDAVLVGIRNSPASAAKLGDDAVLFAEAASGLFLSRGMSERQALLAARVPPELAQADARARERVRAALARLETKDRPRDAAQAELDAAYLELETVVARVQREARRVSELVYPRPRTRADIEAGLKEGEALVLYHVGVRGAGLVIRPGATHLVALSTAGLDAETELYLDLVQTGATGERAAAAALYARVVAPLEEALAGATRVIVCPDGPLHLLPFAALARGAEGTERLGQRFEIGYAPSGTVLLALQEARAAVAPARGVIALGDPVYPTEGSAAGGAGGALRGGRRESVASLVRLPETSGEARGLADKFPSADRVLLLREAASRERLLAALAGGTRRKAVHLACHAILDVARPRLCGVVLAGGDLLTADDVDRLDVPADLVVLSACETGRGRIERGEGVAGLTRSFLLAGASRVLVSLWKVDDRATRMLMDAFYDGLFERGLPATKALAEAQRQVREHTERTIDPQASRKEGRDVYAERRPYEAPRFWAGWCLWGLPD